MYLNETIQNTLNTSTLIAKTPTHYKIPTYIHPHITKQVNTTTVQDIPKWNSHNTIKYPQYKVALMYMALFISKNFTVTHFTSLKNTVISHKSRQFAPHHYSSHHFTHLRSIPTSIPLLVTTFLTLFLNVFSLHWKDASKLAGNCVSRSVRRPRTVVAPGRKISLSHT